MTGQELVPKVYDAELADPEPVVPHQISRRPAFGTVARRTRRVVRAIAEHEWAVRARSVAAYRLRQAPRDTARLAWFALRGHGRWIRKGWFWASYADLRADARAARLAGDAEARRTAQEMIRADAKARWAKVGLFAHRSVITAAVVIVVVALLRVIESVWSRAELPAWLRVVYGVRDGVAAVAVTGWPVLVVAGLVGWLVAAVWEGRDHTPGAGWLTRPDRDDADSWVDERMISRALAHLGIAPLTAFFKNGGELVYLTPARKDGDGTGARVRLPLGVTAEMVSDRRKTLAANLGRASLETWPTTGDEDGVLDLWIADRGILGHGAGDWPLLHDGTVDLFDGVPFGLTQRGLVITAPLIESNWLVGGRPGQGKTSALRTLLLGAGLDPTAELWVFVMGESPDFDPLAPRLSRYRMGMDDSVAADAVQALDDLLTEMERRGQILGQQPGRPPKVSRKLADRRGLGLHPLVVAIDECHELFQHTTHGRKAEELAVRLIKRGRKYGIILLMATQSPTKDSIPKEITRNVSCGVAFAVADHIANDGLLGSGKYRAGIRATELRMKTDRGTCVAVGVTDSPWELVRTFYITYEDGTDDVSPIVDRAITAITDHGLALTSATPEQDTAPVDHLADIAHVMNGETRTRTQVVLGRLAAHNPGVYEAWTARHLRATLHGYGVRTGKSDGAMVVRATDITAALSRRTDTRKSGREAPGSQGVIPPHSQGSAPWDDLRRHPPGRQAGDSRNPHETPRNPGLRGGPVPSLPDLNEQGDRGRDGD